MKARTLFPCVGLLFAGMLHAGDVCVGLPTPELQCIYTNFGSGQSYVAGSGLITGYSDVAIPFTPTASFTVDDIEIAAFLSSSDSPSTVTFSIYDTLDGVPNNILESYVFTGLTTTPGVFTDSSVLHPLLTGGQEYWVDMTDSSGSNVIWNANGAGTLGVDAILAPTDIDPAMWDSRPSLLQGAVALDGTPGPTPEPAAWMLAAGPLLYWVLYWAARRRRA